MPNASLEEPPSFESDTSLDDVLRLERASRLGQRLRVQDLQRLEPTKSKHIQPRGSKPTRQGGGRVHQPGGGMRGN
jgi:hypothetical protein